MKLDLTQRQIEILKMILISFDPIDVDFICSKYKKSERSIRYDISVIKQELIKYNINLKNKTNQGFYIPKGQKQDLINLIPDISQTDKYSIYTDEDRYKSILIYMSLKKEPINSQQIADNFFISRSTFVRMIDKFEEYYGNKIKLETIRSKGYVISGDEKYIRELLVDNIYEEIKDGYSSDRWYDCLPKDIKEILDYKTLKEIVHIIKKLNSKYNIWITNYSFVKLLSYCIVTKFRISNNRDTNIDISKNRYSVELLNEIFEENNVNCNEVQMLDYFLNKFEIYTTQNVNNVQVDVILGEIINYISNKPKGYSFDIGSLYLDLKEHLNRFVNTSNQFEDTEDNKVLNEIKTKYRDYYDIANECSKFFENHSDIKLSEMEIAYIGIYLYKNRTENSKNKRVLIVCATGKGVSHLIATKIKNTFNNIDIVDQISPYQIDEKHKWGHIDFVISNIPIKESMYPVIKVSSTVTRNDIHRIDNYITYGEFVDSIPFNNDNEASITSDNYLNTIGDIDISKTDFIESSKIISKIYLDLIDRIYTLPKSYHPTKETILGLYMHIILAIPRWYENKSAKDNDVSQLYFSAINGNPEISEMLEEYFGFLEKVLQIELSISEKYAFYIYLIDPKENNDEKNDN